MRSRGRHHAHGDARRQHVRLVPTASGGGRVSAECDRRRPLESRHHSWSSCADVIAAEHADRVRRVARAMEQRAKRVPRHCPHNISEFISRHHGSSRWSDGWSQFERDGNPLPLPLDDSRRPRIPATGVDEQRATMQARELTKHLRHRRQVFLRPIPLATWKHKVAPRAPVRRIVVQKFLAERRRFHRNTAS